MSYTKLKPLEYTNLKGSSLYFGRCQLCKKYMQETHYFNVDGTKGYFAHLKCIKNYINKLEVNKNG